MTRLDRRDPERGGVSGQGLRNGTKFIQRGIIVRVEIRDSDCLDVGFSNRKTSKRILKLCGGDGFV